MLQIQKINFNNVTFKGTSSIKNEDMTPSQLQSKETALTSSLNCLSALGQSCICKNCTKYTPFQELYIKNGVAYDKQGLLFTGETQIQKDESETILSYENGILKKSTHTISNAKLKEETIKEYNGNSNDYIENTQQKTTTQYETLPDGSKRPQHVTFLDSDTKKTENGYYQKKITTELNGKGKLLSITTTETQFALLKDGSTAKVEMVEYDDDTTMSLEFKTPQGAKCNLDYSNMRLKYAVLPGKNGTKIEFSVPDLEENTTIKKTHGKDFIITEIWDNETLKSVLKSNYDGTQNILFDCNKKENIINPENLESPFEAIYGIEQYIIQKLNKEPTAPLIY